MISKIRVLKKITKSVSNQGTLEAKQKFRRQTVKIKKNGSRK